MRCSGGGGGGGGRGANEEKAALSGKKSFLAPKGRFALCDGEYRF